MALARTRLESNGDENKVHVRHLPECPVLHGIGRRRRRGRHGHETSVNWCLPLCGCIAARSTFLCKRWLLVATSKVC